MKLDLKTWRKILCFSRTFLHFFHAEFIRLEINNKTNKAELMFAANSFLHICLRVNFIKCYSVVSHTTPDLCTPTRFESVNCVEGISCFVKCLWFLHSLCTTYPQVHISHIHCSFSAAVGFGLGFGPNSSFGFFVCFVVVVVVVMSSLVVLSVSNDRSTTSIDSLCSFESQIKSIFQINIRKPEEKSSDFDFFSKFERIFHSYNISYL